VVFGSAGSVVLLMKRESRCGTERMVNLWVGSSKPSTFSRMPPPERRDDVSRFASAGFVSKTNSDGRE
jgi:hypothetical protein